MRARHLVLFDIDGTLTATTSVDDECYAEAVAVELGLSPADIAWSGAPHMTDAGIAEWLWLQHRNRQPSAAEIRSLRKRFITLLKAQLASSPDRFLAVRGASNAVEQLRDEGWAVAFATGCWRQSARLKLRAAGIGTAGIPLACADDALSRDEILLLASRRCTVDGKKFDRVVSVGDATWDVATARRLSLPFVGVAQGEKAERLKAAGASHVLADLEYGALRKALDSAKVPSSGP